MINLPDFVKEAQKDDDIYSKLMAISQEAIEEAHYETAYHALYAALHYAQEIGDESRLKAVEEAAIAQRDWIDAQAPKHRMSSQSATLRQGVSLYDTLRRQAATQALLKRNNTGFKQKN
ncbi:hypothetical protein [Cylindrospermum sp. FACHB-282]|uniref:hypothetical protein n=1 Tax=Cylindrospermum sp. FACHB-282 TaxID=2692794 RepID=UPI0016829550|nr:hypothetical protein [Cylindrospermum sp. FACHB-282]MBD2386167.1 hypothetical protein [Cylindrospermum sp. FACHB-282]